MRSDRPILWVLAVILLVSLPASTGGPLVVNGAGDPLVWDLTGGPVPFNSDQGMLGTLDSTAATDLVAAAFGVWAAVPSSTIGFTNAGALSVDVTEGNIFSFLDVCGDGLSPIIYDTDGAIVAAILGSGAENFVLGFAGLQCFSFVPPVITEGVALLNGRFIDGIDLSDNPEISVEAFTAVFIHEFGHYISLDHTQINLDEAFDGDATNDAAVPTMFPILINGLEQATLHRDDIASISTLYPAPDFFSSTGTITGTIFLPDGVSPFQGANVIARNVANPLEDAISNVSGARFFPFMEGGPPPPGLEGLYEINGLTPGASYTVEIEQISPAFSGGSGVGPVDPPRFLPGPPEFWNGGDEANENPPDDPSAFTLVPVVAGIPASNIDIIINGSTGDPNEPNDDLASATPIACPSDIFVELQPAGDVDFYRFTALAGTGFTGEIRASRIGSFDSLLGLFDASGNQIAVNDDFFGLDSFISVTLPASPDDVYFVAVTGFPDFNFNGGHSQSGPYQLVLDCAAPLPPIPAGTPPESVLFVGAGGGSSVLAFADLDGDGEADAQTTFGSGLVAPAELAFDSTGRLFGSGTGDGTVLIFTDSDQNFVSDVTQTVPTGLTDGDGMALKSISPDVLFVSDAFGGGTILTFEDTNGDGIPDPATSFASGLDSGISLDFDSAGNLYVIDVFVGVLRVCTDADGDLVADGDPCPVFSPDVPGAVALKLDAFDNVIVADAFSSSILVLRDTNGDLVADTLTTFAVLPGGFFFPFSPDNGMTFDLDGNLAVLTNGSSILVYSDANGDLVTDGPPVTFVSGLFPAGGLTFGPFLGPPNPVPMLTSISPSSATAGGPDFTLTATGSGFIPESVVRWNGGNRPTTFVSETQLQAEISAGDLAEPGTAQVTVFNRGPGGGTSSALTFTINLRNPYPVVTALSPSAVLAGGVDFTLSVTGSNFVSESVVRWDGVDQPTTFVSPSRLEAAIPAADIATEGLAAVTVFSPSPGGGTSNALAFSISNAPNPVPAISSISPGSTTIGREGLALTVNGNDFLPASVVRWNGSERPTAFVSSTVLEASISADDLAVADNILITVFSPEPGGGTSNSISFTINNPDPALTALSPSEAPAGGSDLTLTVNGSNFVPGSVVLWNGLGQSTTFVSSTHLRAAIPASDIASAVDVSITVLNPAPGGGISNALPFTITGTINPEPLISSLLPNSATAGDARISLSLTVNGSGFSFSSVVRWNGSDRSTTFVSEAELQASIPASDLATAGTAFVTVFTPAPGGGTSNGLPFGINHPVPVLSSLDPSEAVAGGADLTLTVIGSNFVRGAVVQWDGSDRPTTFVNSNRLQAFISSTDIAVTGTAQVTAFNPTPGGGTSNSLPFAISNSVPTLTALTPSSSFASGLDFTLTVSGSGFIGGSVVRWNGSGRPTTFLSSTQLEAAIAGSDIASPGIAEVRVFNPAPGGGLSNPLMFSITASTSFGLPTNDIIYDPASQRIYASVPGSGGVMANSIAVINPMTGAVETSVPIGSEPNKLAISDNGQFLYVGLDGDEAVRRLEIATLTPGLQFTLGTAFGNFMLAEDIEVLPGNPEAVAISRRRQGVSPRHGGVAIYDNGVQRTTVTPDHTGSNVIEFSASASTLYGYNNETTEFGFRRMAVDASGVSIIDVTPDLFSGFGVDIEFGGGLIFSTTGRVVDPTVPALVGTFLEISFGSLVEPDVTAGQVYFLVPGPNSTTKTLKVFDLAAFTLVGSIDIPDVSGTPGSLIRWGANGLAFRTSGGQIFLISISSLEQQPQLTSLSPGSTAPGGAGFTLTVNGSNFVSGSVVRWNGSDRATTFVSSTELQASIAASDVATAGASGIRVFNPGAFGALSNPLTFTVTRFPVIALPTNDITYDPGTQRIYASVPGSAGSLGNSIAVIDPATGAIEASVFIGSEPNQLAISDDGQFLYVGLDGAAAVRRLGISTLSPGLQFALGSDSFFGPMFVEDMEGLPGNSAAVAISRKFRGVSPRHAGVAIYDDGVPRSNATATHTGSNVIEFSASASTLYGYNNETTEFGFRRMAVDASGVSVSDTTSGLISGFGLDIEFDNGRIFSTFGQVVDPEVPSVVGTFSGISFGSLVEPDSTLGQTFFLLGGSGTTRTLTTFNETTFAEIVSVAIEGVSGAPGGLIRWGTDGLAFRTDAGQVFLIPVPTP